MSSCTTNENQNQRELPRRRFLGDIGSGLAGIALAALLAEGAPAAGPKPRARRVLQVFCPGGASHLDLWDYKPELIRRHGELLPGAGDIVTFQGGQGRLTRSPYEFRQRGQSGQWISDAVPNLAALADDICFIHGMTARSATHGPATLQMNTGYIFEGFPSMGAWVTHALGSLTDDLPAFVALPDVRGMPVAGPANWSNGFLPATTQGTAFNAERPIPDLLPPPGASPDTERRVRAFLGELNRRHQQRFPGFTQLDGRIAAHALAGRMQLVAPEATDLRRESEATMRFYGADDPNEHLAAYARNCVLARRLLERGVRFVQLFCGASSSAVQGLINWDAHERLQADLARHCPILDRPTAALLLDLKRRGLLEDTLVLWTTEFGRMPTFQANTQGRDHNPQGFTVWMAGAGVRGGTSVGATDALGYKAAGVPSTIYDFHATVLHLLGFDHRALTYYHNGVRRRLTDVHGSVIHGALR